MAQAAMPFIGLGLHAVNKGVNHYEEAWHPIKQRLPASLRPGNSNSKSNNQNSNDQMDDRSPEERGLVLRKRSEIRPDEVIVERYSRPDQQLTRRPDYNRRASSLDRSSYDIDRRTSRGDKRVGAYRGGGSDSEGSVPPQSRQPRKGRARSVHGNSKRSSSSSSSTTDLGSSTDDEKRERKLRHKKWLTAGLATVATIHAAAKVYSSLEAHDKRAAQVKSGEMSPEEARKKQTQARWQDAAAVGIAALGIKGTMSEWEELKEQNKEHKEERERHEEMHRRRRERERMKRRQQSQGRDRDHRSSDRR